MIFYSSFGIAKEIIGKLLGNPISKKEAKQIESIILSFPEVKGVHDLMIHDYGPGRQFGSAHAEVDAKMDFLKAHDIIDEAERKIHEETGVMMTLHLDPILLDDPLVQVYQAEIKDILSKIDSTLSIHDFRIVDGPSHTNLVFDVLIPYDCSISKKEIEDKINTSLKEHDKRLYAVITFDHEYVSEQEDAE